jgi:mRNA-degrading endonuclease toxin of MazEF toxin-antitoxin module
MGVRAPCNRAAPATKMKRGTVCWINLEDATPPEFAKTRPGIIVSNSEQNTLLQTVVAVPLSTNAPAIWPLRLRLEMHELKISYAILPGIRQVTKTRLLDIIDIAPAKFMRLLDRALDAYLSD